MASALERSGPLVGGVDEAGRGPLLGDVFAACVVLPDKFDDEDALGKKSLCHQIKDSKKLSAKKRELLSEYIKKFAVTWGIGRASPDEIDSVNILNATYLAMHRAIDAAYQKKSFEDLLVDGPRFKPYTPPSSAEDTDADGWLPVKCVPDGDATHLSIAAASILAKVAHDAYIKELVEDDPELNTKYGIGSNMGYGTKVHMDGLVAHGAHAMHRKSFAPVKRVLPAPHM
jgi:ribonuclease HII